MFNSPLRTWQWDLVSWWVSQQLLSQSLWAPLVDCFLTLEFLASLKRGGRWLLHTLHACLQPSVQTEPESLSASQLHAPGKELDWPELD